MSETSVFVDLERSNMNEIPRLGYERIFWGFEMWMRTLATETMDSPTVNLVCTLQQDRIKYAVS